MGMNAVELLEQKEAELVAEYVAVGRRRHDSREWEYPLRAAAVVGLAIQHLLHNPLIPKLLGFRESTVDVLLEAVEYFAARDARGEYETCGHCHTTNRQTGRKWGYCDSCHVMDVYPQR